MMKEFHVNWQQSDIDVVLQQVRDYQLPNATKGTGWSLGCDYGYVQSLQQYWLNDFDWAQTVEALNKYPQFVSTIDGIDIHYVHVVGEAQGNNPLLMTHGWPGSHYEFWSVIEPLVYPSRFGGNSEDAVDLVIPSLPGFGFSGKPHKPTGQRDTAALFNQLMVDVLGYERYLAQGGDFGAIVSSWLGLDYAQNVRGLHLNMLPFRSDAAAQNDEEIKWFKKARRAQQKLSAYSTLHVSKPGSLIWAVANSPMAQATWILERFHDWSDLGERDFSEIYRMDELLTNIMIYVMSNSFASAVLYYPQSAREGYCLINGEQRVEVPTAFAAFPNDALMPCQPRSRAELSYNIVRWQTPEQGGHFAAMEQSEYFVNDIQAWIRALK